MKHIEATHWEAVRWLVTAAAVIALFYWLVASLHVLSLRRELADSQPPLGSPPDSVVNDPRILERARTIILVRVVEVERQDRPTPTYATMRVLKSWKGPFSAGDVLHTPKGNFYYACGGIPGECYPYDFQFGDQGKEFLIMNPRVDMSGEIFVRRRWVWPAARSEALTAALDQAVRTQQDAPH